MESLFEAKDKFYAALKTIRQNVQQLMQAAERDHWSIPYEQVESLGRQLSDSTIEVYQLLSIQPSLAAPEQQFLQETVRQIHQCYQTAQRRLQEPLTRQHPVTDRAGKVVDYSASAIDLRSLPKAPQTFKSFPDVYLEDVLRQCYDRLSEQSQRFAPTREESLAKYLRTALRESVQVEGEKLQQWLMKQGAAVAEDTKALAEYQAKAVQLNQKSSSIASADYPALVQMAREFGLDAEPPWADVSLKNFAFEAFAALANQSQTTGYFQQRALFSVLASTVNQYTLEQLKGLLGVYGVQVPPEVLQTLDGMMPTAGGAPVEVGVAEEDFSGEEISGVDPCAELRRKVVSALQARDDELWLELWSANSTVYPNMDPMEALDRAAAGDPQIQAYRQPRLQEKERIELQLKAVKSMPCDELAMLAAETGMEQPAGGDAEESDETSLPESAQDGFEQADHDQRPSLQEMIDWLEGVGKDFTDNKISETQWQQAQQAFYNRLRQEASRAPDHRVNLDSQGRSYAEVLDDGTLHQKEIKIYGPDSYAVYERWHYADGVQISHSRVHEGKLDDRFDNDTIVVQLSPRKTKVSSISASSTGASPTRVTVQDSKERRELVKVLKKRYPHGPW